MSQSLKQLMIYTASIIILSIIYFVYYYTQFTPSPERETFLSEIGEGIGTLALWALCFIYLRTALKLLMGKGALSKRLLPEYTAPPSAPLFKKLLAYLDRTHVHVGIATTAIILLHIGLMGMPLSNLFFVAVLLLVLWQAVFGMFLRWRAAPRDVKKFSYQVHAQLITGVALGLFAFFGHGLV